MATKAENQKIISQLPKDLTTLTEAQYNQALNAYNELQNAPVETTQGANLKDYFTMQLRSKIASNFNGGIPEQGLTDIVNYAVDSLKGGNYNPQQVVNFIISHIGTGRTNKEGGIAGSVFGSKEESENIQTAKNIARDIPVDYTREVQSGRYDTQTVNPPNYSNEIGNLQSLLNPVVAKRKDEEAIQSYLKGLPQQNETFLSDYEKSLGESQGNFFNTQLAPGIAQFMNARGLINSGDLTSSLAEAGGKLQQGIRDTVAPLRFQLGQDVSNKKYENLLRGSLEGGKSLADAIAFTRDLYKTDVNNSFLANQGQLNRDNAQTVANQQLALLLAMNQGKSSPTGLDYFLQYGLPTATTLGNTALSSYLNKKQGTA